MWDQISYRIFGAVGILLCLFFIWLPGVLAVSFHNNHLEPEINTTLTYKFGLFYHDWMDIFIVFILVLVAGPERNRSRARA